MCWSVSSRGHRSVGVAYYSVTSSRTMSAEDQYISRSLLIVISLTDEVIKSKQCAAELCHSVSPDAFNGSEEASPLSPFMMTRILDPMHRSISSRGIN
jgi:hypothetical protein